MKKCIIISLFLVAMLINRQEALAYDFYTTINAGEQSEYKLYFNVIEGSMYDLPLCEVTYSECEQQGDEILYNKCNSDYKGAIIVPETVEHEGKTYKVYKIGDHAFQNCKELTVVYLEHQNIIGKEAFKDCVSLSGCNPENYSVYEIHASAFENCKSLKKYRFIPDNFATPIIEEKAFAGCTGLESFSLYLGNFLLSCPENVFYRDENNFIDCYLGVDSYMIEQYKSITPWCWFKQIEPIDEYPTGGGMSSSVDKIEKDSNTNNIYTLDGVNTGMKSFQNLPKGIYIQGNKKIFLQ